MLAMPNWSYLNVWCKDFPEELILERFRAFLGTVPFSAERPGFTHLTIRAVDAAEIPTADHDLRAVPLGADDIIELCQDHLHSDSSYEVECHWDVWLFDAETTRWKTAPRTLAISCHGEDYDDAFWRENGHFEADLGFEHLFTGHAGLLGIRPSPKAAQSPEEARFLEAMAWPENLRAYQGKTQENIRKLLDWTRVIEKALPGACLRLWSEGGDNFEARLDEILAAR